MSFTYIIMMVAGIVLFIYAIMLLIKPQITANMRQRYTAKSVGNFVRYGACGFAVLGAGFILQAHYMDADNMLKLIGPVCAVIGAIVILVSYAGLRKRPPELETTDEEIQEAEAVTETVVEPEAEPEPEAQAETQLVGEEYIDIYDENHEPTGRTIPREGAVLKEGEFAMYNLAILENLEGKVLITQRSQDKHWAAGWWEVSGGGAQAGEDSLQAITREVREEVGLDISGTHPECIYTYENIDLERGDNYFVNIYYCHMDFELSDVTLQQSEAVDCKLVTWEEICKLADEGIFLHFNRLKQALVAEGLLEE